MHTNLFVDGYDCDVENGQQEQEQVGKSEGY